MPDRCFDQWHDRGRRLRRRLRVVGADRRSAAGLAAAINFAGGRGSRADNDVCDEDALVRAFATLARRRGFRRCGSTRRTTSSSGPNWCADTHLPAPAGGPSSSTSRHSAMTAIRCFARISLWTPVVDSFLRDQSGNARYRRDAGAIADTAAAATARQGARGIADYLSASPHRRCRLAKAFAFRGGRRSTGEAVEAALAACAGTHPDCALYAVDDQLAETANTGSR